ncbi:GNAT family N-acetyltransferase [Kitasatospora sp. NBC_00240]|uniref:GNAT family N-acetyltransferase n=1 Tax=Kitasatospora sp. NBC_00240 TaxID=2903567 RepID=UPI00224FCBAE|nr:GNAT family protein [Kitasatospora sp. NBC_00240]MCX5210615.1 GNAT family N-acetyltransferase [Kitasatospora sp. NBC_00240]
MTEGVPDDGGVRVTIRAPRPADVEQYADAVRRSAEHIGRWNPVEPDGLPELLARQGSGLRTFLIVDQETGGLVGKCNVANIVMGRFCNGALGYDSYEPFAGTGRMTEGMLLVVDRCFADQSTGGLGLHRLEINVQPENERSAAMARRLGFRHEGFTPRMLYLGGAWRDHERFAMTSEEWPGLAGR